MIGIAELRSGLLRRFAFAATAMLVLAGLPEKPAQAMTLLNAGAAPLVRSASEGVTTEVRFGHGGGGWHGGAGHAAAFHGGGWRGGGIHYGGAHFGGMHYGGYRYGGFRYGGYGYHRHFHRHFFAGGYYPYGYGSYYYGGYYPHHRCRIVWTYYGPHRVCHWRHWHRPYYW